MANEFRIKNGAISPNMVITDTNVSTSTTTGALQVAGGVGIVGNVYAGAFYGPATGLTSIPGANVTGAVPSATSATTAGTVTTNAQPNITSLGTLTGLTSSGAINVSNSITTTLSSGANASAFNASFINGSNIIRIIGNTVASSWNAIAQQNDMVLLFNAGVSDTGALCIMPWSSTASGIRFTPGNNAISGNVTIATNGTFSVANTLASTSTTTGSLKTSGGLGVAGNIYAGAFYGPGTGLTAIPGANVSGVVPSATVAATVTTAAQPNITSLGTLSGLTSSGAVNITNTTQSTSTTTGAVTISGGIGVAGKLYSSEVHASSTTGYASIIGNTSALTLGRIDNTSSSPRFDFNSGATTVDYDARFACTGGNGTIGYGNVYLVCNSFDIGGKFGYRTGTGLSVTQLTSRTTGVTVNALSGRITLVSATTTAGQVSTFTVTNSFMASADTVYFTQVSGTGHYIITTKSTAAGSFSVNVYTPTAVSSAEAPAFNFAIIRGTLS